jgi:NCS1 family nucleobase:cation symporter-1
MLVDYFFIRRGNLNLPELFTLSPHGRYYFFHGFNVRAFAAFVIGFLLPLPGFAASFGHDIGEAATHMYALGWVLSFLMGSLSYYVICLVWKIPGDDHSYGFESQVEMAKQIIVEGLHVDDEGVHISAGEMQDSNSMMQTKDAHVMEKMA